MAKDPFPHLRLLLRSQGRAHLTGGGKQSDETKSHLKDRSPHGGKLRASGQAVSGFWKARLADRNQQGLPELPQGVPLLLQIDPNVELDFLRSAFGFEIVSEQPDGYVIVVTQDIDMQAFLNKVNDFIAEQWGAGGVAQVHHLFDDPDQDSRLKRILSDRLYDRWSTIEDKKFCTVDIGIESYGDAHLPELVRDPEDDDDKWQSRVDRWSLKRDDAKQKSEATRIEREEKIEKFVRDYGGEILDMIDGEHVGFAELADSFTARVKLPGRGLRDLALNFPFLFEVTLPDDMIWQVPTEEEEAAQPPPVELVPPHPDAPRICVIDSGVQENHRLLEPAIETALSHCFLPGVSSTDVADHVPKGGHGTRVAGAVLYPREIPEEGVYELLFWIQNARVLDSGYKLPINVPPPSLLRKVIERYHAGDRPTRIFNHSIASADSCRITYMTSWAAEIDQLSFERDILIIQAAGNLLTTSTDPSRPGIREHLQADRPYPSYLLMNSSRVANPAQSMQAITVGSIAHASLFSDGFQSLAHADQVSGFSRNGPGIWDVVKPDVVEYGGDNAFDSGSPPNIANPTSICTDLVRSSLGGPSPSHARDCVGTSFAAPKVSHVTAAIAAALPDEPTLLYRALIAHSGSWPAWAHGGSPEAREQVFRQLGFGLPDKQRATSNTPYRVTMITSGVTAIKARECHIYQVPIPEQMREPGEGRRVLVQVTLSYAARPRRTRRSPRHYLSTWVDWITSKANQSLDSFEDDVLRDVERNAPATGGEVFPWVLRERADYGLTTRFRRNLGTLQKDWAIVNSYDLPQDFCLAVRGHPGWDNDIDATAKYTAAVSFEMLDEDLEIYDPVQVAIDDLEVELSGQIETELPKE